MNGYRLMGKQMVPIFHHGATKDTNSRDAWVKFVQFLPGKKGVSQDALSKEFEFRRNIKIQSCFHGS